MINGDFQAHFPIFSSIAFRVLILVIFLVIPLQAYVDPGGGLLFWQVAGAFFLGVVYQVRKFFGRNGEKK
jgi:hypothetical protein